ncbi:primosomal protein N' [Francisella sp. Scap27]|uniref:replication restart helicase PriA n=1 Tax=Francisella sp. Scap27 TaxID=2589986 RepID=UPI0015C17B95|nr:primosomal protein N' [Francisella sp. Scap27]QLE79443.1 primosomal protein N' [Francisella sp. Scap27]
MIVKVALQVPPNYLLDYSIDSEVNLFDRVLVQVGKRQLIGFVVVKDVSIDYPVEKVKPITKIIDSPISLAIQKLIYWIAGYYCCDLYNAIRLALPNDFFKSEIIKPQKETFILKNSQTQEARLTVKQQAVLDVFEEDQAIKYEDLKSRFSLNIITRLIDKNILIKTTELKSIASLNSDQDIAKKLNEDQQTAFEIISRQASFKTFLLYGVTGSGKTEVYLQAIQRVLDKDKQILVLIPEINLTPQTLKRFELRFPTNKIVTLHSKVSEKTRLTSWLNIRNGEADIVISTRSGVLSDFKSLGMIIVDEEHDSSFKQQSSTIRYNARDVAIYRASQLDIPIVLGSATPSIESYFNCKVGKYELLKLKSKALNNFSNEVRLIDLKSSIVDNGICSMLFDELGNNINAHSQSLVFINKLGFAKALVCKSCNVAVECEKCDKPYTLHTHPYQYLQCHFCGTRKPIVTSCQSCDEGELFTYGTGTEKVQSRIESKFPYNKIIRFDRNNIKTIDDLDEVNKMISSNMVDVIVGTQMIAKGHHFANITLVGLINIDAGLYSTDFHAIEKTAQLIVQVSGRAGRADKPGKILLQTYQPENKLLQLLVSSDYLNFLDYLLEQREYAKYPPYTFQAQILAESRNEQVVLEFLNQLYAKLAKVEQVQISKPLPALHLKRNNTYRYSLLLTSSNRKQINSIVSWVRENALNDVSSVIKVYFDIDPIELA